MITSIASEKMKNPMKSRKSPFTKPARTSALTYLFTTYITLLDNIFCFDIDCRHMLYFLQGSNLLQIHVAIFPILELSVLIKFSTYNIKLLVLRFVYSLNNENQNLKGCHF